MTRRARAAFALEGGGPFVGRLRVPGDKSISHRALMLGALAEGVGAGAGKGKGEAATVIRGRSDGEDVLCTERALQALGAEIDGELVKGGRARLHEPKGRLDFGNSGTGMRLVSGLVAGWPWSVELVGDDSLSSRPMDRIAEPLRLMGARIEGRTERCLPPLHVRGGSLHGIEYESPMASAQVKSCVLLAGLRAEGATVVRERVLTRTHTEELLAIAGARIAESFGPDGTHVVTLEPSVLEPFELEVPGDPSQAAFWLVAACLIPGSDVTVENVYIGRARTGFLEVLKRMKARVEVRSSPSQGGGDHPTTGDLVALTSTLVSTEVDASEIPSLDEVPILAVAAALAEGTTVFRGLAELRVKESDRMAGVVDLVRSFGAEAEVRADDLYVSGVRVLSPASFDARGDHRLAMAAAIAASTVAGRPSRILGWDSVDTSYPSFRRDMARLTGAASR